MSGNETTDALFAILHQYDDTWAIIRESDFAVVLEEAHGRQIHAPTLEAALRAALSLYEHAEWNNVQAWIMSDRGGITF